MLCNRCRLLVFTRYPEPGRVKTRLISALGPAGAAELHRQMVEHCLWEVRRWLAVDKAVEVEMRFTGGTAAQMRDWLGDGFTYRLQDEGDLGDRLSQACRTAFNEGATQVLIIGTDCPGVNAEILTAASQELPHQDVILGPATDGGYYLIGMQRWMPELFQGIAWSTASVLAETLAIAQRLQLRTQLLTPLSDVDYPADLVHWERATAMISVIIPTLNEAQSIAQTLANLKAAHDIEIIVADGGSRDQTVAIAASANVQNNLQVITTAPGRAQQMNQGARLAKGEVLLFLHADTQLPQRFDRLIREALASAVDPVRPFQAGAFALSVDAELPGLRWIEWWVNWRSRRLAMPYGDQAIFLRAATFRQLGGFPAQPIMEDYELMRRLKKQGLPIVIIPSPVVTSARRWQRLGVVQTTIVNQAIVLAYRLGLSPTRLAQWYRGKSKI